MGIGSTVVLRTKRAIYTTCRIVEWGKSTIRVAYMVADALQLARGRLVLTSKCDLVLTREIVSISERW